MAIAFGPLPPGQAQQQQVHDGVPPAQNNPVIVDVHRQHFQDANNNNVVNGIGMMPENPVNERLVGYLTQFVQEVLGVFERNRSWSGNQHESVRERAQARNQSRRQSAQVHEDNQNNAPENHEPNSAIPSLPFPLPDLITCHAGLSFRYGSSRPPDIVINAQELDNSNDHPGPQPLSPRSSQHNMPPPETSMDFEVSLKLEVSVGSKTSLPVQDDVVPAERPNLSLAEQYRLTGAQLREIADNFRVSQNVSLRYRRRTGANRNRSTLELNLVFSVAVPAVAILGLGLVYLRRR